jgi:hypothetical protein
MDDELSSNASPTWETETDEPPANAPLVTRLFLLALASLIVPIAGLALDEWWTGLIGYLTVLLVTYPALSFFRRACQRYESTTGDPIPHLSMFRAARWVSVLTVLVGLGCAVVVAIGLS